MTNRGRSFRDRLSQGHVCLGTGVSFSDPTVTEALCGDFDFVFIDLEHTPLSLEAAQAHIMATGGSSTTPLVRVPWNDAVWIKRVLDIGAAGVVIPLIRTPEEAREAVAACNYPPDGLRGFGPRRPSNYGRVGGPDFCREANADVVVILQIETIDAVENLDEIVRVPGLTSVAVGSNDLAGSMGHMGEPRHPEVLAAIDAVIEKARENDVFVGMLVGDEPELVVEWIDKGAHWVTMGGDYSLLVRIAEQVAGRVRDHLRPMAPPPSS